MTKISGFFRKLFRGKDGENIPEKSNNIINGRVIIPLHMPYRRVIGYLRRDFYHRGREYAYRNPNVEALNEGLTIIADEVRERCEDAISMYTHVIINIKRKRDMAKTYGLHETVQEKEAHIEQCTVLLEKVKKIQEQLDNNELSKSACFVSFRRGFTDALIEILRGDIGETAVFQIPQTLLPESKPPAPDNEGSDEDDEDEDDDGTNNRKRDRGDRAS